MKKLKQKYFSKDEFLSLSSEDLLMYGFRSIEKSNLIKPKILKNKNLKVKI